MSLYLEWSKRVEGFSNGSVGISGGLRGLRVLADALVLENDRESVSACFSRLEDLLEDGRYTATNWSKSEEWDVIKKAVEAGRQYRLSRDAELTEVGKKASDTATLAGQLSGRLKTAEGSLTTLKSEAKQTASLASGLQSEVNSLKKNSLTKDDFGQFKTQYFDGLSREVSNKAAELATLTTLVKNEQSTWTDTGVPSPLSGEAESSIKARTMPWGKDGDPSVHIGDTYIVTGTGSDRGKMYRFVRNSSSQYYWEKVADNDGTLALSKVSEEEIARKEALTNMQTALTGEMKTIRTDLKQEATNRQSAIASAVQASESKMTNNISSQLTAQVQSLYSVQTFQEGSRVSGRLVSSAHDSSGGAVIRHTAVVRDLTGTDVTQSNGNGLQWEVNKGRTSAPLERSVTGAQCDVSESDLVKEAGAPAYYDIELYREF